MDVKNMTDSEVMVASVMQLVSVLSNAERDLFLTEFRKIYCHACGADDPRCQCWNDE